MDLRPIPIPDEIPVQSKKTNAEKALEVIKEMISRKYSELELGVATRFIDDQLERIFEHYENRIQQLEANFAEAFAEDDIAAIIPTTLLEKIENIHDLAEEVASAAEELAHDLAGDED